MYQNCPVNGRCQVKGVVYKAKITTERTGRIKYYIGMTGRTFKSRWGEHKTNFKKTPSKRPQSSYTPPLYTYVWDLQDKGENYSVQWEIIDKGGTYNPTSKKCMVCLKEKFHIMYDVCDKLNKRNEVFSRCRHIDQKRLFIG